MESPPKMQKLEKCRFWPHCKNGDQCPFHHPSVECKYGTDLCLLNCLTLWLPGVTL